MDQERERVNLSEYGIDLDLLSSFIFSTIEFISHWEEEEDFELLDEGNVLISCITKIIDVIRTAIISKNMKGVIEKINAKERYELYMDIYANRIKIRDKEIPSSIKKIIKHCLRMEKQLQQVNFLGIIKCVPYLDEQVKYFHRGMVGLMEMSTGFYDYPILSISLSDYFCSGVVVTDKQIIWNFLPGSPEARMIKAISCYYGQAYNEDELKEGEKGYVYLEDIVDVIAYVDYAFVNLCIILRTVENWKRFLPISLLSVQSSKVLCQLIRTIVNQITHRKFSKKKVLFYLGDDLKIRLNDVLKNYDLLPIEERRPKDNAGKQQSEELSKESNKSTNSLDGISDEFAKAEEPVVATNYVMNSNNTFPIQNVNMMPQNSSIGTLKEDDAGKASLILGICSIVFSIVLIGFFHGIIGIILAISALKKKNCLHRMAVAGLICSIVGIIFSIMMFLLILMS